MRHYTITVDGQTYEIDVQEVDADSFRVVVAGQTFDVDLTSEENVAGGPITPAMLPNAAAAPGKEALPVYTPPAPESLRPLPQAPQPVLPPTPDREPSNVALRAPMPGTILVVDAQPGAAVTKGQRLFVLEAMKMKNPIRSPRDGEVSEVLAAPGQTVNYGDMLLRYKES